MIRTAIAAIVLLGASVGGLLGACAGPGSARHDGRPLALRTRPAGDSLRLELTAAPGWKVNARLKPVLEGRTGTLVRFDSPSLTPDSAYFTQPPVAVVARRAAIRGTVRASVCAPGAALCRVVVLDVGEP